MVTLIKRNLPGCHLRKRFRQARRNYPYGPTEQNQRCLTLLIEALIPMNLILPEGMKILKFGDRVDLPEPKARKLLELAKGKVQIVNDSSQLHPSIWVEFLSPLFGRCTARIHEVTVDGCIITDHSVLKGEGEPVTIPASWIYGVYREQQTPS